MRRPIPWYIWLAVRVRFWMIITLFAGAGWGLVISVFEAWGRGGV